MVRLEDGKIGRVKNITDLTQEHTSATEFEDLDKKEIPKVEDPNNEFKEFFQYDVKFEDLDDQQTIKEIKYSVQERFVQAVSSFGNSHEGFVYLGIKNDGSISGLEKDKQFGNFENYEDDFGNHIRDVLGKYLEDKVFITSKIQMKFQDIENKTICIIRILPADKPLYLRTKKEKAFFVRNQISARSEKLDNEDQFRYIKERFPNYK